MPDKFIIEINDINKFHDEVRNEITEFFDKYNIAFTDDDFRSLHSTYISLFKFDIRDILNAKDKSLILEFRIIGATRGAIHLEELYRECLLNISERETHTIYYKIKKIEFINSTCFETFKVYSTDVVEDSEKELCGKELIIKIHK